MAVQARHLAKAQRSSEQRQKVLEPLFLHHLEHQLFLAAAGILGGIFGGPSCR